MKSLLSLVLLMFLRPSVLAVHRPYLTEDSSEIEDPEVMTPSVWTYTKCTEHASCKECDMALGCHWCKKDSACHAKGSIHGCSWGVTCDADDDHHHKEDKGCAAKRNCRDCSLTNSCHWCAHDNACHRLGSRYGCLSGVDCYSNDRCMRKQPEALAENSAASIGIIPIIVLAIFGCCMCCCTSSCFFVASGVKGAYDDLADIASTNNNRGETLDSDATLREPLIPPTADAEISVEATGNREEEERPGETEEGEADLEAEGEQNSDSPPADEAVDGATEADGSAPNESATTDRQSPTTTTEDRQRNSGTGYVNFSDLLTVSRSGEEQNTVPPRRSIRPRRPRHMQRLYNVCTVCYLLSLVLIGSILFAAVRFYPRVPFYNICNDAVAWKSIIDNFASAHPAADIQILGSLSNPNHIDVVLDVGKGSFYHNDAFVGTFDIPPVTVKGMSITDFMIVAHLAPDKWDALSLSKEYYQGHLVLSVDTQLTVRVPALANYRFSTEAKGMQVYVNELSDRSLCACPTWDEPNSTVPIFMSL